MKVEPYLSNRSNQFETLHFIEAVATQIQTKEELSQERYIVKYIFDNDPLKMKMKMKIKRLETSWDCRSKANLTLRMVT